MQESPKIRNPRKLTATMPPVRMTAAQLSDLKDLAVFEHKPEATLIREIIVAAVKRRLRKRLSAARPT